MYQVNCFSFLAASYSSFSPSKAHALDQTGTSCCYAKSDKYWIEDPQGVAWETFHTLGSVPIYGEESARTKEGACCIPLAKQPGDGERSSCCVPTGKAESEAPCCS